MPQQYLFLVHPGNAMRHLSGDERHEDLLTYVGEALHPGFSCPSALASEVRRAVQDALCELEGMSRHTVLVAASPVVGISYLYAELRTGQWSRSGGRGPA